MTTIETASREQLQEAVRHLLTREARQLEALRAARTALTWLSCIRFDDINDGIAVDEAIELIDVCLGDTESETAS